MLYKPPNGTFIMVGVPSLTDGREFSLQTSKKNRKKNPSTTQNIKTYSDDL
jgi:hypothetical protein